MLSLILFDKQKDQRLYIIQVLEIFIDKHFLHQKIAYIFKDVRYFYFSTTNLRDLQEFERDFLT